MLSGSVAMSLYIVPRATRDFDFIIHLLPKDIDGFVRNFEEGYYCEEDSVLDAVAHQSLFNIIDFASGFKADFVILKKTAYRQEEFERRVQMDYFGKTIYVVSPEDLLISKLIWIQDLQSPIQMEDVSNLTAMNNLDFKYIDKWLSQLQLKTFNLLNR